MGRHSLDSINDFARLGYRVRFTCQACGYVTDADAVDLMGALHRRRQPLGVEAVERRAKCSKCGERRAKVTAALTEW